MYRKIRRTVNELRDETKINLLLSEAKVGYLGLCDEEGTYVVPMNFVWLNNALYFHSSDEGRKSDALNRNHRVCFTISEDLGIIAAPIPANIGTAYTSVMIFGYVKKVEEIALATQALQAMLDKFVPGYFDGKLAQPFVEKYRSSLGSKTVVYRLEPDQITAKEATADLSDLFYPGRKQVDDLKNRNS